MTLYNKIVPTKDLLTGRDRLTTRCITKQNKKEYINLTRVCRVRGEKDHITRDMHRLYDKENGAELRGIKPKTHNKK